MRRFVVSQLAEEQRQRSAENEAHAQVEVELSAEKEAHHLVAALLQDATQNNEALGSQVEELKTQSQELALQKASLEDRMQVLGYGGECVFCFGFTENMFTCPAPLSDVRTQACRYLLCGQCTAQQSKCAHCQHDLAQQHSAVPAAAGAAP